MIRRAIITLGVCAYAWLLSSTHTATIAPCAATDDACRAAQESPQ